MGNFNAGYGYNQVTVSFNGINMPANSMPHEYTLMCERDALARERDEWRQKALTDTLTDLPNRRALLEHLGNALSNENPEAEFPKNTPNEHRNPATRGVAIAFIDLDGFKKINDTYGHDIGDDVLQKVANFLSHKLRNADKIHAENTDMAARLGGDEFVIVLHHTNKDLVNSRIKDIEKELNLLYIEIEGSSGDIIIIPIGGSIGVVDCDLSLSAAENLKIADAAMYTEKQNKKAKKAQIPNQAPTPN